MEHGAYLKYGRRPVSLRRNPRGCVKGSMSSRLSSNNRRLKGARLGGARHARRGPRGPVGAGALALARGSRRCKCMDLQYRVMVGAVLPTQGVREGVQYYVEAGALALARGSRWCKCMDLQDRLVVGAVLPTQGAREGVQYYVMPWWRNWVGIQYLPVEEAELSTQSS